MTTVALTSFRQQALTFRHQQPLVSVLAWEIRRFRTSRRFWLQALGFFCLVLALMWYGQMPAQFSTPTASGSVDGTSAWGLLLTIPIDAMLLVLFLPFMNADGVTRDLSRRTHELLMTTALPNWAYIWGRYLAGLLISLGMAALLLVAILGMGWLLSLTTPAYPAPNVGAVLLLWGGMVVPAVVLVSNVSFVLGTLFPRRANLVKIVILVMWIVAAVILPDLVSRPAAHSSFPAWYMNWDPTSRTTAIGMFPQYQTSFDALSHTATTSAQLQNLVLSIENKMPDVSAWLAPHLIETLLSLLLVVVAMFAFRRFRTAFEA